MLNISCLWVCWLFLGLLVVAWYLGTTLVPSFILSGTSLNETPGPLWSSGNCNMQLHAGKEPTVSCSGVNSG